MRRHEAYPSRYTKAGDVEKPTLATITTVGHEVMQDGKSKPVVDRMPFPSQSSSTQPMPTFSMRWPAQMMMWICLA